MNSTVDCRPLCAVVVPVSTERDAPAKRSILRQTCHDAGFRAALPDFKIGDPEPNLLTLEVLERADVVIVDLTNERPSCYLELGYASALRKPVILVAQAGTPLHQLPPGLPVHWYGALDEFAAILAARLREMAG